MIRPGRVDIKEYIGHCSKFQIEQMYKRFFPKNNRNVHYAKKFAEIVIKTGKPVSAAQIQGYFMLVEDCSPEEIVKKFELIWE